MDNDTTATVATEPGEASATAEPATDLWPAPIPTFTYLAGAAGSGKTFATKEWAERDRGLLLTASTGIAAINLGGATTINAALGYFNTASLKDKFTLGQLTGTLGKLWKSGVTRIVIDEASMIPGEALTYLVRAVDEVNGKGYVLDARWEEEAGDPHLGLTLVGDPCQLGPIADKPENPPPGQRRQKRVVQYAFESVEWEQFAPHVKILTEIRRQADPAFIEALRAARRGDGAKALEFFQSRLVDRIDDTYQGATIFAKNDSVDRHNQLRLDSLKGQTIHFGSARWGKQRSEWGNPEKPPATWGIPETLVLKEGAWVMVLANSYQTEEGGGRRLVYVNGDCGEVVGTEDSAALVRLQRTGAVAKIAYVTREVKVPCDSVRRKELREAGEEDKIDGKWEIVGSITYMPLRLAWASTVHRSQGLSLDRVQIDLRDGFFRTPGMVYVALSRARTVEGLRIIGNANLLIDRCRVDPKLRQWL